MTPTTCRRWPSPSTTARSPSTSPRTDRWSWRRKSSTTVRWWSSAFPTRRGRRRWRRPSRCSPSRCRCSSSSWRWSAGWWSGGRCGRWSGCAPRPRRSPPPPSALDRRIEAPGSGDEIDRLAQTLNRMLDRLQSGQERQRRFVSDASHELRSPVAALRQTAEVALAHPDRLDSVRLATTVAQESVRLGGLIEGLLLLARADEARLVVTAAPVDLDDLALLEVRRLRDSGVLVDASGVSPVQVVADEALLSRALRNLVDNAVRHRVSRLALTCRSDGAEAVLAVDDDGPGIPDAERERVLERFVRLDEGRARDAGGSGLGLAIVAGIAAAHGGRVIVGGSALGGARVEVRVPLARG
ncbi:sensor histidine kinase [Rathayibacter tanaceti]|uniref:sensor histidine kinase n=1 Tax=Rathayibacter tanaceti TaxID=1671680 RepID=UPI001F4852E3|nr:HAMP domain-containing sensor histidine kinase [Rathayibacter tanaceti]